MSWRKYTTHSNVQNLDVYLRCLFQDLCIEFKHYLNENEFKKKKEKKGNLLK